MAEFRFTAKNVFLTYPRCDVTPADMGEHLKTIWDCKFILVVQENHDDADEHDGIGVHLHCLLMGNRKKNIKRPDYFDFRGFHPNIQAVRKPNDVFNYCLKGYTDRFEDGDRTCVSSEELTRELLTCKSEQQLLMMIDSKNLHSRWQFYKRLWALNRQNVDEAPVRSLEEFDVPILVRQWMENPDNRSLILVGAAGTGKTSMARSLASELGDVFWCPQRERLAAYAGEHTIIFDDTDFAGCGRTTLLNYLDMEQSREFRVLYGTVAVGAGTRRIFTTNGLEHLLGDHAGRPEIQRRILVVHVEGRLFQEEAETEGGTPAMVCRLVTRS